MTDPEQPQRDRENEDIPPPPVAGSKDRAVLVGVFVIFGIIAVLLSLFAPYTAEESWQLLGNQPSVACTSWPTADQALLTLEKVTCVVQVNGKVRDKLEVPPQIGEDELRELALAAPGVVRALGDQQVSRVIVRAPKLVSIVAA